MPVPPFKELLNGVAQSLREDGRVLSAIAGLFFFLPLAVVLWLLFDWSFGRDMTEPMTEAEIATLMSERGWMFIPVGIAVSLGQLSIADFLLDPDRPTVGGAITRGLRLLLPYLAIMLVAQFLVQLAGGLLSQAGIIGLLLFLALAIFVSMRLFLLPAVLAASHDPGVVNAAKQSWDLSKGKFWQLYLLFVVGLVGAGLMGLFGASLVILPVAILFGPEGQAAAMGFAMALVTAALSLYGLLFSVSAYRRVAGAR